MNLERRYSPTAQVIPTHAPSRKTFLSISSNDVPFQSVTDKSICSIDRYGSFRQKGRWLSHLQKGFIDFRSLFVDERIVIKPFIYPRIMIVFIVTRNGTITLFHEIKLLDFPFEIK